MVDWIDKGVAVYFFPSQSDRYGGTQTTDGRMWVGPVRISVQIFACQSVSQSDGHWHFATEMCVVSRLLVSRALVEAPFFLCWLVDMRVRGRRTDGL